MTSALILFAKPPLSGRVKTRLVPPLTAEQAAGLYGAFLRDVTRAPRDDRMATRELHVETPYDAGEIRALVGDSWEIHDQVGENLGSRLVHAFDAAFARGFEQVVVRNTDSPDLPVERELEAFSAMVTDPTTGVPGASCVLGPDAGGGYYLVGLRERCWEMFLDLPMSVATNFERTLASARERFSEVVVLAEESDVDVSEDLRNLATRLSADRDRASGCPATCAALGDLPSELGYSRPARPEVAG